MNWSDIRANLAADLAAGVRERPEDLVVAALVMASFALALTLVVSSLAWWPPALMIALFLVLAVPATLWNAGWRARTTAQDHAGA
jgi:hypothetical protein